MKRSITLSQTSRRSLIALLCAAAAGGALAQDDSTRARPATPAPLEAQPVEAANPPGAPAVAPGAPLNPRLCPNPQQITITMPSSGVGPSPASPTLSDFPPPSAGWPVTGSAFNQTQSDKQFGHTFNFKRPQAECCQYGDGVLTVTYKALSSGASNDAGGPFRNGQAFNSMQPTGYNHIWGNAPVAVGTVVTKSYPIPAGWIASGRVSFGAQDDTAVVKATLQINGCCLTPTPPAR